MTVHSRLLPAWRAILLAIGLGTIPMAAGVVTAGSANAADAPPILRQVIVSGLHSPVPCEGDSIRVVLVGDFPNDCYRVARVEVMPVRCYPCAPPIRVLVDNGGCLEVVCVDSPVPWRYEIHLPPLPPGGFQASASLFVGICTNVFPSDPPRTVLMQPFSVRPESLCVSPPAEGCLLPGWSGAEAGSPCNAHLDDAGHATLGMTLHSPRPLRALQGRFHLSESAMKIVAIRPIGPAKDATLVWHPVTDGATFVLFSADGTAIPAGLTGAPPPDVIAVEVSAGADRPAPRVSFLSASQLIGADLEGHESYECPTLGFREISATICGEPSPCDANGDGRSTIGDIVTLLRCWQASCPDSARFDCDGDGDFDLDDVLCCARRLLATTPRPPGGGAPAPGSRLEFGEATKTASGWRVPLRLEGVHDLGGARLALRFPSGAYRIGGVTRSTGAGNWLLLSDVAANVLSIGLVDLDPAHPDVIGNDRLEVFVDLEPNGDAPAGGSIVVTAAELAAADGRALEIPTPAPLLIPDGLQLSAARPNPFVTGTEFAIAVDHDADVRVTIHDVSGRLVRTLYSGRLAAGTRTLRWSGEDDAGRSRPGGVYFARAAGNGIVATRKLVLLRGH